MSYFFLLVIGFVAGYLAFWSFSAYKKRIGYNKIEDTEVEGLVMRWFIDNGVKGETPILDKLLEIIRPFLK